MSAGRVLLLSDAPVDGLRLPKLKLTKFKNLVSADGHTYYLLATRVKKRTRVSPLNTNTTFLDFAERHPKRFDALFIGVKRGLSKRPVDCSYLDQNMVLVHDTPEQEIRSVVNRYQALKSGSALALFRVDKNLYQLASSKSKSVKTITFDGKEGALTVNLNVKFEAPETFGGVGQYTAALPGQAFSNFSAQIEVEVIKRYLWNGDAFVRIASNGLFEFDSDKVDGTLYLPGKLS